MIYLVCVCVCISLCVHVHVSVCVCMCKQASGGQCLMAFSVTLLTFGMLSLELTNTARSTAQQAPETLSVSPVLGIEAKAAMSRVFS